MADSDEFGPYPDDWCCRGECCGPGSWCCQRAGRHDHDDLPGMWESADVSGGWADTEDAANGPDTAGSS